VLVSGISVAPTLIGRQQQRACASGAAVVTPSFRDEHAPCGSSQAIASPRRGCARPAARWHGTARLRHAGRCAPADNRQSRPAPKVRHGKDHDGSQACSVQRCDGEPDWMGRSAAGRGRGQRRDRAGPFDAERRLRPTARRADSGRFPDRHGSAGTPAKARGRRARQTTCGQARMTSAEVIGRARLRGKAAAATLCAGRQ